LAKERRLGRGLEALLSRAGTAPTADESASESPAASVAAAPERGEPFPQAGPAHPPTEERGTFPSPDTPRPAPAHDPEPASQGDGADGTGPMRIDVDRIDSNPFQPRQDFDETDLQSLADSLTAHGLLQPLVVRRVDDRYQLVAGERRLRAATRAGWTQVPVQVVEADDRDMAELAIVENMQRKDLNPLEKAASFQRYLQQYGATQEELAGRLKLDRSTVANLIRLLELPEPVQDAVRQGRITQGHARALLPLGEEREQIVFCERIQHEGLSVRRTESLVQEAIQSEDKDPPETVGMEGSRPLPRRATSDHIASLEQEFRVALGTVVKITHNARGRGKITIHFSSHEEFDRLRDHICEAEPVFAQRRAG